MKRIVVASGILALALVLLSIGRDAAPAEAITVFGYTNVTEDSGCLLVPEGTAGAPLIAATGFIQLGRGGSTAYPLDDTYTWGQFLTPAEEHAEYFDRIWYQINDAGTATFDLGEAFSAVYIALSQDHGPYPEEAIDYLLAVSNDNSSWMTLPWDTPITMYRRGWSADGETVPCVGPFTAEPGGQVVGGGPNPDTANDDWSVLWHLPAPYRYVQLTAIHHEPRYNDPEIDAVMGMTPPEAFCTESVNPAGKKIPPAGSTTLPGPKGGQNEDGFYELGSVDAEAMVFVSNASGSAVFGPFPSGTVVKITEAPGATPKSKPIGGPNSAVAAHITLDSDPVVFAVDSSGLVSAPVDCLVPPPPK